MAGGKETPRQKMIGLMYLVLTAMLALNVSASVLEKFIFIDESLERSVAESQQKNQQIIASIQKKVEESGNRQADVQVLNTAREVREKTNEVLNTLNNYKEQFVQLTGGKSENGQYVGVNRKEPIENLMVQKGKGEELKSTLNSYAGYLAEITGEEVSEIALDGNEHPYFKNDPEQARKDFSELTFQSTPMVAGLASLSQLKTEVISRETRALEDLARSVGAQDIKFDRIRAMVRPESRVVAAGTKYSADLFIAASSSGVTPDYFVNGQQVSTTGDGYGKVEFVAQADNFDEEGRAVKSYQAEIRLKGGQDTTFTKQVEYVVSKPVIQVQSASVQALYFRCGNKLNVNVPALGSAYNPSFNVRGGQGIKGGKAGQITIVPTTKDQVELRVSSNGNYIGSETFNVRGIPNPTVEIYTRGGQKANLKQGESLTNLRGGISIQAEPDPSFQAALPDDARYRVAEAEVILARGSRPLGNVTTSGGVVNLGNLMGRAQSGDRLVISVTEIQRKNFQDNVEDVGMGEVVKTIPIQ